MANEQVINGYCERHPDTKVEQRFLEQWFFAITRYAERLLKNLDWLDWSDSTRPLQRTWIGGRDGAGLEADQSSQSRFFRDRERTQLNSSHGYNSHGVFFF